MKKKESEESGVMKDFLKLQSGETYDIIVPCYNLSQETFYYHHSNEKDISCLFFESEKIHSRFEILDL